MIKLLTLFLNWVFMIGFFCLGAALAIIGLVIIVGSIVQTPYERSEFIFAFAMGVLWLIVGVGMCFLAPMLIKPSPDLSGMSREEKTIENIKEAVKIRKLCIVGWIVFLAFVLWYLMATVRQIKELDAETTPEQIVSTASFDNPEHELPILFSRFYTLAKSRAELIFGKWLMGMCAVFLIIMLIIDIGGFRSNRYRLTISMWERIQELEKEVRELKTRAQPDAQDVAEPESGQSPAFS